MNDAIGKRIGQVVSMFDNYAWYSLERFPPLYVVQDVNTRVTLQLNEDTLFDLVEADVDKLKETQLYKMLNDIPVDGYPAIPDLL